MNTLATSRLRARHQGQYLILGLLALIIFALLLAYGISTFVRGRNSAQANTQSADLIQMIAGAQALYRGNAAGFNGVTSAVLIQNNVVPKGLVKGGGGTGTSTIVGPFGEVTVTSASLYGTDDGISFAYANVPSTQCSAFVTAISSNVTKVEVGGTAIEDQTAGTAFDPAALGTACAAGQSVTVTAIAEL